MAGIYVHIPFCASFCTYCGFYSETVSRRLSNGAAPFDKYVSALEREMSGESDFFGKETIKTVYFGGGTPSMLPPESFERIVAALRRNFDLSSIEEFSVEVNPDDIAGAEGAALLETYRNCGVNRISMGVQSFCDEHLRWMNRRHNVAEVYTAFDRLRAFGFDNVSIDLIFGFSGLSTEQWRQTLECAIQLDPEHISSYQMSIDAESALAELLAAEKYKEPDEDICAEQYRMLQRALKEAGYVQYEISSFCKPGFRSRHNSSYWAREPYLGLGAAAHSFDGNRLRRWNVSSVSKYCSGAAFESETLLDTDIYNEEVMLGLRTAKGVRASLLSSEDAMAAGLVYLKDSDRFAIPFENFFICDSIIEKFIRTEYD